jgi:hypothetical protein
MLIENYCFFYCYVTKCFIGHRRHEETYVKNGKAPGSPLLSINQSINQFICQRQLNVNSHWLLYRVGALIVASYE